MSIALGIYYVSATDLRCSVGTLCCTYLFDGLITFKRQCLLELRYAISFKQASLSTSEKRDVE